MRKTAHVFGAVSLRGAEFTYQFAEVFNGWTFWSFLKRLVRKYRGRRVFMIIDNAPAHNLPTEGKEWLAKNRCWLELHRLPPYSPEYNPMEPVWKVTRKKATHNRFYATTDERDAALRRTFRFFQRRPDSISAHVARFQ